MISWLLLLAGQELKLPPEVKGEPAAFVSIVAETPGKVVRFVPLDSGLSVFPAALLSNPKATVVVASKAGRYRVLAYTAVGEIPSEPAVTTVVIGGGGPPDPLPPGPAEDPLARSLASIFGGLQEPGKAATVAALAKVYRAADPSNCATLGEFHGLLLNLAKGVANNLCAPIRERLAEHLTATLGDNPATVLDDAAKVRIKSEMARIASILEGLK